MLLNDAFDFLIFEEGLELFGIMRMYAFCIMVGIIFAVILGIKEGNRLGIYSDFIYNGVLIIVPLSILGARLWYVIFSERGGWTLAEILGLNGGMSGLAIQGGVIVAIISVIVYCRVNKVSVFKIFDLLAPGLLIGQICGRWGNFFNKELFGPAIENVELFKLIFPKFITENMYLRVDGIWAYRHPTFLYESMINLVGLITILVLRRKSKKLETGDAVGIYLLWYGLARIPIELLRMNSGVGETLGSKIPVSLVTSIGFIIAGGLYLVLKRKFGPRDKYLDLLEEVRKNKIDTVIFDLDGTLLDTKPLIDRTFYNTFKEFMPDLELTDQDYQSFFGPTLHQTFSRFTEDQELIEKMIKFYRKFNIENHNTDNVKPFNGCKEVLKYLKKKGIKLAIVSSKKNDVIKLGLDLYDLEKYFDVIIGADDVKNHKPDPEGIKLAVSKLSPKKKVLYVGDNPSDIMAGKNAGVKTCDVMYSDMFEECEKLNPDYCICDLNGILKILGE